MRNGATPPDPVRPIPAESQRHRTQATSRANCPQPTWGREAGTVASWCSTILARCRFRRPWRRAIRSRRMQPHRRKQLRGLPCAGGRACNANSLHVSAFLAGAHGVASQGACEACHGPGSEHAKRPDARGLIIGFTHGSATPVDFQARTCLGCHAGGARQHWDGSVHERRGLSCSDCHNPMARLSAEGLLAKPSVNEVCSTCHRSVRAQFNRRSHMPLPEGQWIATIRTAPSPSRC